MRTVTTHSLVLFVTFSLCLLLTLEQTLAIPLEYKNENQNENENKNYLTFNTPSTSTFTTTSTSTVAATTSASIGYQIHSVNDIKEWPQLIRKGTDFFKIDGHYTRPPVCQSSAVKSPSSYNGDPRGCMLLTHDPPSKSHAFYSSSDVLTFLQDPLNRPLLTQPSNKITLYTDWKFDASTYPWVDYAVVEELRTEFVLNISQIITQLNLNVGLLTEGYGGFLATYCPSASEISNNQSCYYTNSGSCAVYGVLNCEANPIPFDPPNKNVDDLCPTHFGKFTSLNTSWVYWEPTDQPSIYKVLNSYLKCNVLHEPGFRIAINTDPIHYEVGF